MNQVAVVILNYNGENFLKKFLPTLLQNTPPETQIVVADNASTDGSIEVVKKNFEQVKVILLNKNYGFAEGYNQALKQVNAKYFVLLNSDVEVTENWLPPLIQLLEKENIVACQPKVLAFNNKESFEYAGAAGGFIDRFGYPFCRGRIIGNLEIDKGQYDDEIKVFWATGACMAIRAELFHKVDGFDGDFFAHMEEIDLCWRLQKLGYTIAYTSKSVVYHVGGGTLAKSNPFKTYLNFRNGLSMLYKNWPENGLYITIFIRLVLDGIASLGYLTKGQFGDFFAVIKAHFAFYASIKALKLKRVKLLDSAIKYQNNEKISYKTLIYEYFKSTKLNFSGMNIKVEKLN